MPELYIEQDELMQIKGIIKSLYPHALIWAYGSRVGGDEKSVHAGSDLDLCVKDFGSEKGSIFELREAFSKSNIPFLVDIFEYDKLPKSFQEEICEKYVVIYCEKALEELPCH